MDELDAWEIENAQGLDKLPPEVWEKILDELDGNDLFPLALSCRYFRQKQKELVARTRQGRPESGKPRPALRTTLRLDPEKGQPASADYLWFCINERGSTDVGQEEDYYIWYMAAFHGHLPLLRELLISLETRLDPEFEFFDLLTLDLGENAARGGQPETLQGLKTRQAFELTESIFQSACEAGHLEVLKWLRSEGCPWNEDACTAAASGGHLDVLKWLRSEGCPWDESACAYAAEGGHLEVLKWLRKEGCPWNEEVCAGAALGGQLEVLKWLRSKGCPWNDLTWVYASSSLIREWLVENGCPQGPIYDPDSEDREYW